MGDERVRLDICVMNRTGVSRVIARELIMRGDVRADEKIVVKPGEKVKPDCVLDVKMPDTEYVGRGGYKLEHGLDTFGIVLDGKVCADIGASTGGFTDCMLRRNAAKVYAIDNGREQLAKRLRDDKRVVSLEETNINNIKEAMSQSADFAAVDVSFVSVTKVINAVAEIMRQGAEAIILIKPQFEAGRENIGKNGLVKDEKLYGKINDDVGASAVNAGLRVLGLTRSPILGKRGNTEFLMYCAKV